MSFYKYFAALLLCFGSNISHPDISKKNHVVMREGAEHHNICRKFAAINK
jgi:hypothetical protein